MNHVSADNEREFHGEQRIILESERKFRVYPIAQNV